MLTLAGGDFVERIVVVDAEEVFRLDAATPERTVDRVMNDDAPEGADVNAFGGRFRVVVL